MAESGLARREDCEDDTAGLLPRVARLTSSHSSSWRWRWVSGVCAVVAVVAVVALSKRHGDVVAIDHRTGEEIATVSKFNVPISDTFPPQAALLGPDPPQVDLDDFLASDLSVCSCNQADGGCATGPDTLVSAIVNTHKARRSFHNYVDHFKALVQRYPKTPIVGFVQKGYGDEVRNAHPNGPNASTLCLVEITLDDLPLQSLLKDWARVMLNMHKDKPLKFLVPETIYPEYDIVTNSKVMLVGRAAQHNPFKSERFAWIDGGLHPPMTWQLPDDDAVNLKTCGEKVCIGFNWNASCRVDLWKQLFSKNKWKLTFECNNCQNGSCFTGTRKAVMELVKPHFAMIKEYLKEGIVDDDQGPMMEMWMHRPDLVQDTGCAGWMSCAGYLLGSHQWENASRVLLFQNCSQSGFAGSGTWDSS